MKIILFVFFALLFGSCNPSSKIPADCKGEPVKDCICTKQYDPVCGCDNKTYGNSCEAGCAGVKSWKKGECPPKQ